MDFDDYGSLTRCDYCRQSIKGAPLHSIDGKLTFCDVACAKIYNDRCEGVDIDKFDYDKSYEKGLLTEQAAALYLKLNYTTFKCLPTSKTGDKSSFVLTLRLI